MTSVVVRCNHVSASRINRPNVIAIINAAAVEATIALVRLLFAEPVRYFNQFHKDPKLPLDRSINNQSWNGVGSLFGSLLLKRRDNGYVYNTIINGDKNETTVDVHDAIVTNLAESMSTKNADSTDPVTLTRLMELSNVLDDAEVVTGTLQWKTKPMKTAVKMSIGKETHATANSISE